MNVTFRQECSLHGFRIDVLKSALQKYTRRSNYEKTIFCAQELDLFAEISGGERIRTNFIHRLMIIFLEDIGLGGIAFWSEIDELIDVLLNERKKKDRSREKEVKAIHELIFIFTRLPKLRIASFAKNYWSSDAQDTDYKDTSAHIDPEIRNKLAFMADLENSENVKDLWKKLSGHKQLPLMQKWYRELKSLNESFLCWTVPLCADIFGFDHSPLLHPPSAHINWDYLRDSDPPQFDPFVFDKHTHSAGNKTLAFFAEHGAHVEPESRLVENPNIAWLKWLYLTKRGLSLPKPQETPSINGKDEIADEKASQQLSDNSHSINDEIDWNSIQSETQIGKFVLRIQLTTSKGKCDVYLVERNNKPYIVKGPYPDSKIIDRFLELQKLKADYGMASIKARSVLCLPDRWSKGVPLGIRNTVNRTQKSYFLVSDSLIPTNKFVGRLYGSKIWPKTMVMNPEKTALHAEIDQLDEQGMLDYYHCVAFRLHFKLSDMAKRNFLYANGRVYSIDEESTKDNIDLKNELRGDRWKILSEKWSQYSPKLSEFVRSELHPWFGKNDD